MKSKMYSVCIRITQAQMDKLTRICRESGRTVSEIIRGLLAKI